MIFLLTAALVCMLGAFIHGYTGGRRYLGAIKASSLEPLTKSLSLVAWQAFTVLLLVCAGTLALAAVEPSLAPMVWPVIAVNALISLLFVYLSWTGHGRLRSLPGAYLTGGTAILAFLGVV